MKKILPLIEKNSKFGSENQRENQWLEDEIFFRAKQAYFHQWSSLGESKHQSGATHHLAV